jgi:Fic family protein
MSEELDVLIREADKKKAELGLRPPLAPDAQDALEERFLYACIYNSNAIEGNQLSEQEIETILTQNAVVEGKSLSDHLCIVGYRDAMLLAQYYAINKTRITEYEIKNLHYRLLIDQQTVSGQYRTYNLMIRGHRPTSYEKVPYKMLQLVEREPGENEHPIEAIAFFHLRLEKIHPFGDGNGRVGRLVMNAMLEKAGYPQVVIPVEEKQRYYEALEAYDGLDGNPRVEPMQILLAERVIARLDELLDIQAA